MKFIIIGIFACLIIAAKEPASPGLNATQYSERFHVSSHGENDRKAIERCLNQWSGHPFKDGAKTKFRIIESPVKVLGIGGSVTDKVATSYPQLVLISPSIKVLSNQTFELMNPNGWYCFKSNVTVLSKNVIKTHCHTMVADSRRGTAVLGKNDESGKGGVTVLGKTKIEKVCP